MKRKFAVTGGTGFIGRHLARTLIAQGHEVVLLARGVDNRDPSIRHEEGIIYNPVDFDDVESLSRAISGCEAVAHCAGINREIQAGEYQRVHVAGTRNLIDACKSVGVRKILLTSFLRARANCGSPYHESKWQAEELVRQSGLDFTVLKTAMVYGTGDHMLDHLSHALFAFPLFASVGLQEKSIRPVSIDDVVSIIVASLVDGRMPHETVAVVGPDELPLSEAVKRIARAIGRPVFIFPMPVAFHYTLASLCEATMKVPLISKAQVKMLSEGISEPKPHCDGPPADLAPGTMFTQEAIKKGLPAPGHFPWGIVDERMFFPI